jgi:hypothetical protein
MFRWIDGLWNATGGKIDATISRWVHDALHGLWAFLSSIFLPVRAAWDYLWNHVVNYHDWIGHLGTELYRALRDAYDWINHNGYILWYYITHPDKLVALIYDDIIVKIEDEAVSTAEKLGKFFLALIIKNVKTLVTVIEDIVDAVF